jgi:hypothetical protein
MKVVEPEPPENAAREAHFAPLKKRSTRIKQLADDIIAH